VAATLIHLVRHGEVHNPRGILYGRLPGYHLSSLGYRMAEAAAAELDGHHVSALYASPLLRAQESAKPWSERFDVDIVTDDRLIEPFNRFEGERFEFGPAVLTKPRVWRWVINPWKPSWGEPYTSVANRMLEAIEDAWTAADGGEVVMVSHQMPIVMVQRSVAGEKLFHDPRKRRCSLSSITTLQKQGDRFVEVGYQDLAAELLANSIDTGAV
jgi:broad specificity phosphatase PhoE